MIPKSLVPDEESEETKSSLSPGVEPQPRKPYTKRKAQSADEINTWANNEIEAGKFYSDEKEVIRRAVTGNLKSEKIG